MRKQHLAILMAAMIAMGGSMTSMAATAQDVINMNQTSYTAGTSSVYGPSLTQDQLNAVAQAVANFKTNYINDSMDNDTKIRTAYDYLVNNVEYIDWNKGEGANAAYGALVKGQAACSGYARAFKALCDSIGVSCYYIHSTGNDHQWNMVEFNDGYYFVDVQANDSSGFDWIYHSSTHPYTYDTSQFPAVGSKSGVNTSGTTSTVAEGWQQDTKGWWWRNADGSYPTNQWKEVNGKQYYFGADGYMLTNTTTPDGYKVGADGAWIQEAGQGEQQNDGVHTMRVWQEGSTSNLEFNTRINYPMEMRAGVSCAIVDDNVNKFVITSEGSNLDTTNHTINVVGFANTVYGIFALAPDAIPVQYSLEYDKEYSLDFMGTNRTATELASYCKQNNIIIKVEIADYTSNAEIGHVFYVAYQ